MATERGIGEEIRQLLLSLNEAWVQGRPEDLGRHFDEDMVIVHPGGRAEGRETCVNSYRDFVAQATVHEYKESEFEIDCWGNTAVASYRFDIAYEMNGGHYRESGRDVFVFIRRDERWLAVWRTMIPQLTEAK